MHLTYIILSFSLTSHLEQESERALFNDSSDYSWSSCPGLV